MPDLIHGYVKNNIYNINMVMWEKNKIYNDEYYKFSFAGNKLVIPVVVEVNEKLGDLILIRNKSEIKKCVQGYKGKELMDKLEPIYEDLIRRQAYYRYTESNGLDTKIYGRISDKYSFYEVTEAHENRHYRVLKESITQVLDKVEKSINKSSKENKDEYDKFVDKLRYTNYLKKKGLLTDISDNNINSRREDFMKEYESKALNVMAESLAVAHYLNPWVQRTIKGSIKYIEEKPSRPCSFDPINIEEILTQHHPDVQNLIKSYIAEVKEICSRNKLDKLLEKISQKTKVDAEYINFENKLYDIYNKVK